MSPAVQIARKKNFNCSPSFVILLASRSPQFASSLHRLSDPSHTDQLTSENPRTKNLHPNAYATATVRPFMKPLGHSINPSGHSTNKHSELPARNSFFLTSIHLSSHPTKKALCCADGCSLQMAASKRFTLHSTRGSIPVIEARTKQRD